jgi:hypothetical protein
MWNKDTGRTLAYLYNPNNRFLTYSFGTDYRASFEQALLNLFVDTSDRGVDNFPFRTLARNPWINFVKQENEVDVKLAQLGRPNFSQPDAGQGPNPKFGQPNEPEITYKPWNLFNDFGQPNLFQPWSVAEALMAGAPNAEQALRFLLDNGLGNGLDGPQGLADWALWPTGAIDPTKVPSFADNWNMALSTMALMEFLDGSDRTSLGFANLPEVKAALDTVFHDGDLNGDGVTNAADLAIWRNGFGISFQASPSLGDADGDGDVDGTDFLRWQRGQALPPGAAANGHAVPEPTALLLTAFASALTLVSRRRKKH